ncbi:histone-lysine N-methyltransferase SETMAR [Plakobranchus ocellatus]|uniref:Histone-lysine N-methyltransferase SETMAR n=1 Tax=Plakobranchus ocellatus TaxID=259542 RepID=A0AAV4DFU3_9GAST|nr:histone-lysine N-methyltransferase SETMAR [Plakobranchus ocellatus]
MATPIKEWSKLEVRAVLRFLFSKGTKPSEIHKQIAETYETKRDSLTWKHPSSPVTKKFKVQRSAAKKMATVFWDAKGVILLDILPQGQCINAARYCSTLDSLKEAIRRKRPGLLRRGVVLQHDNATPHSLSANLTQQWLQRYVAVCIWGNPGLDRWFLWDFRQLIRSDHH